MTKKKPHKKSPTKEKTDVQEEGIPTLVTPLQPIARQVGEHVMVALEQADTVAVLTTITGSRAGQQVVSIPLTAAHLQQVHGLIEEIHASEEPEHVPCVGFHCFVDKQDEVENADT